MTRFAIAVLLVGGCSFALVHGPAAERRADEEPQCTKAPFVPVLDGIMTVFGIAATVPLVRAVAAEEPMEDPLGQTLEKSALATVLVFTAFEAAATIYGFTKVNRCYAAHRAYWKQAQSSS
jgi:hypothetical protein